MSCSRLTNLSSSSSATFENPTAQFPGNRRFAPFDEHPKRSADFVNASNPSHEHKRARNASTSSSSSTQVTIPLPTASHSDLSHPHAALLDQQGLCRLKHLSGESGTLLGGQVHATKDDPMAHRSGDLITDRVHCSDAPSHGRPPDQPSYSP